MEQEAHAWAEGSSGSDSEVGVRHTGGTKVEWLDGARQKGVVEEDVRYVDRNVLHTKAV